MKKRVVIVGGGINGLTAANYLQKQNFDVKILEKNDNIGGACVKDSVITVSYTHLTLPTIYSV